ncbi:MAG: NADH:ubiquinone reductase (Na(+)-transporting) subunit A [Porticoccaceae bacterium]|nr:NADH:ubiquinone reductase (Na(+)-transporting) subunit A [Porticoccaceae bacterium]|tara:strand:+ start:348 stop:1688 length:1341 start_codon:yes stop_codon:yes gene_type:complete
MIKIRSGIDLPILGAPEQVVEDAPNVSQVALMGADYHGLKPTMSVKVGDNVKLGQLLFTDKKNPLVRYTAPGAGRVVAVNRGERRVFRSLVIELQGESEVTFEIFSDHQIEVMPREDIVNNLLKSGAWVALRTRPFSKVPDPVSKPSSLFVTAIDSNPLAADPLGIIAARSDQFECGLRVLKRLTDGAITLCTAPNSGIKGTCITGINEVSFSGPHPAGLVGTHIHFLDPVSAQKTVWHIGYQDVIAIGSLFKSGRIDVSRVIALGGPQVKRPRLLATRLGAHIKQLVAEELFHDENRLISGSVFSGRRADQDFAYLGRYHIQISVIREGRERQLLHYLRGGANSHSVLPIFLSSLRKKLYSMTTSTNGSERAMVPIGAYEAVNPLDILPTQLLRALIVGDTEMAQKLGCLELDEEDVGLYTYVCVGKYEYGQILRENLSRIEAEG